MRQPPGNPFRDYSGHRLANACGHYIKQLRTRRQRSVAEREQLVEDVAYLLIALSQFIETPKGAPSAPEQLIIKGGDFVAAFRTAYMHELEAGRYRVLQRAADMALGDRAAEWFRTLRLEGEEARVMGSDAALLKRLRELAGAYRARLVASGPESA
jgi:hypothetical protein